MSNWSLPSRCGLCAFWVPLLIVMFLCRAAAEEYRSPSDGIQSMKYEEGRLSLDAKDASLDKVLTQISRMAMLTILADGPIEGTVTVYADRLPLEKALRKILRGKDTSFVYAAKAKTSPTEYEVKEVRIYVAKGDGGEPRRYSFADRKTEREENRESRPPRPPGLSPRIRGPGPRPSTEPPPQMPEMPMGEETQKIISGLMSGNLEGLDEVAEKLKDANPQVKEQIDQFLQSLEEAKERAEEGGASIPPLEGLGDVQTLMNQMLEKRRMSSGQQNEGD